MPSSKSDVELASEFAAFFSSKVSCIRDQLDGPLAVGDLSVEISPHLVAGSVLDCFQPVGVDKVIGYIRDLNKTYCSLDLIEVSKISPTYEVAAPLIKGIINLSFSEGVFVLSERRAIVHPQLKKPNLDRENKVNYSSVSNLTFLSKILERAILDQLLPHIESNAVIPKFQSAYRKFHSTETALCKIYDLVLNRLPVPASSLFWCCSISRLHLIQWIISCSWVI